MQKTITSKKRVLSLILALYLLPLSSGFVFAAKASEGLGYTLETRHVVIHYFSLKDLKKFDGQIDYSPGPWSFKKWLTPTHPDGMNDKLAKKVDALYEKVQEILDMRRGGQKVTINIFRNEAQLHSAYFEIYGRPCRVRAWYAYDHNAVYLNLEDVHEGILAHEIAHSVIDHYLIVRPPEATAEILARYVDTHLFD